MNIKNDNLILEMNDKLFQLLERSRDVIHSKVERTLEQISIWKYATNEYYTASPYLNELSKLPSGRIRKNIDEKDRLKIAGLYSFGFDKEKKILCSQEAPDNIEYGIITAIYEYDSAFSYYVYHVRYIPYKYTSIISISYFYPYDNMKIFQGVNLYKDWSVYLYEYDKEKVCKVWVYASCWEDIEEYNFRYKNSCLYTIIGPECKNGEENIIWKNKKLSL